MKKIAHLILLGVPLVVSVFLYNKYDKESYYYGYGCTFCNKTIPYGIEPKFNFDYPQRFYLLDNDNFELVGIGFRYEHTNFKIEDFLAYGFNDTSVIAKVTDSSNNIKYLISCETGYKNKKGSPEISFRDLSNSDFEKIKSNYQWFEVSKEKTDTVKSAKSITLIIAIVSLLVFIRELFRLRKNKAP